MDRPPNSPGRSQREDPSSPPPPGIQLQSLARPPDGYNPGASGQPGPAAPAGPQRMASLSPQLSPHSTGNMPSVSTYWDQPPAAQAGQQLRQRERSDSSLPSSPIDVAALQFALPPEIHPPSTPANPYDTTPTSPNPYGTPTRVYDEPTPHDYFDSDSAPLTSAAQPISGALETPLPESQPRNSFQTVSDLDGPHSPRPRDTKMLGFDLGPDYESNKHRSYGNSLGPNDNRMSRSPGTALERAGSIVRAMSQRVVNISGENEAVEQQQRRARSSSPAVDGRMSQLPPRDFTRRDTSYQSQVYPSPEKAGDRFTFTDGPPEAPRPPMPNPLKGRSLGIFAPDNPIRLRLCDILVNPYMEPLILILIVLQTILLAVESAPNVFDDNPRPDRWAGTAIDWAMLGLFIIFTLELIARIIVSGFILNATEYSTIDRGKGMRKVVAERYQAVFKPQRQRSIRVTSAEDHFGPHTFARSFTMMHNQRRPETVEEAQRMQLARRAFLRHGFNRMDFLAVVSFWISFVLSITGLEKQHHLWIFRMLSCLRIVRLLALTNGTSIILRSLKKATPLLLRVSFLILFFWIVFAIIGIQSFKSSFSRQCLWRDPQDPNNITAAFTNEKAFCGGYLNETTGRAQPWVRFLVDGDFNELENGTGSPKGFICPRGSICLEQESPSNNTVNFDNIFHSLEMVFVLMSANTWSDLMYKTTKSDYLPAVLFFVAGIIIMMLWMTNLLIAVITTSFQVIREESKSSAFTAASEVPLMAEGANQDRLHRPSTLQKIYDKTSGIWVLLIATDLVIQASRSADMPQSRETLITVAEIITTSLLDIEMAIRIAADWRRFPRSTRNLFDMFLAVVTTVILIPPIRLSGQPYAWLTVFQILRIYRVVLAVPITRKLILLVLGNAAGIANLMFFVFLMVFLMAIFAVQIFRGEIPMFEDGDLTRISFYNIYNAYIGMYNILSSENWTDILFAAQSHTTAHRTSWYGSLFLIGWFILAFFILVNMFIAVIQENFDVSEDEKRLEQVKSFLQRKELGTNTSNLALSTIFSFGKARKKKDPLDYGPATMEMLLKDAVVREFLDDSMDPLQQSSNDNHQAESTGDVRPGVLSGAWTRVRGLFTSKDPNPFYSNIRFSGPNEALDPRQMAREAVSSATARRKAQREYLSRHPTYNNALYIFTPKNPLRRMCQQLVGPGRGTERFDGVEPNKYAWYAFSAFIYAAIVAMVVLACVTTPLYQKEYLAANEFEFSNWFVWVDMGFAVLFTIEAVIKIIADGLFFTPNAYFRSSWGFIDGVVLVTLWINVITLLANDGAVSRAVGAFKALRALRLLNISNSARQTFHSLVIVSIWKIIGAAFVSISLLIPFAIYALNLFNGSLVKCNGGVDDLSDCFGEYEATPFSDDWPMLAPRVADNPFYSFDDFGSSLFILFQVVSQEGWQDVTFSTMEIMGPGLQPKDLASPGNAVFFIVFNLMATVFILTLFISVFMRNYTEQTGVAFLTADQRSWLELRKLLRQISPSKSSYDESENSWKKWCHKRAIEKRGRWYTAVTGILVLHLILLACEFYPEPTWWTQTRDALFLVFNLIFLANIGIRIMGLGWARFRRSSWDVFSLIAVVGSLATSILLISHKTFEAYIQLHKFFLVAIVLLLIPRNDALDQLFKTAAASLTTIVNLLATWLVFFLVFAIAMTQTFSLTRFGGEQDSDKNFRTVPKALILLFRFSSGEGWNEFMEDFATMVAPFCVESSSNFYESDCGSTTWARCLFIAWNIISMYFFVNLFISLIYESFSYVYQRSGGLPIVDRDEIRRFKEAWRSVDPAGTGFISKEQFPRLLGELSGVFEMRIYDAEDSVRSILEDVRSAPPRTRHTSVVSATPSTSASQGIDLGRLNERLAKLDVQTIRERRRRFNIFFEEVMVTADPDRGISFTSVLMILAHYNIISDSKSLRLDEFLRRRARLQRVEEQVRRTVVLGFFDTLYWVRKFKRHIDKKKAGRMTGVPQLDVPDIFVEDDDGRRKERSTLAATPRGPGRSSEFLGVGDALRPQHRSWSSTDIAAQDASYAHPLSAPRTSPSMPRPPMPGPAFSFELQQPGTSSGENSRRGSSVSPAQVRELLDDSVWVESIRRSATIRKSVRKTDWSKY